MKDEREILFDSFFNNQQLGRVLKLSKIKRDIPMSAAYEGMKIADELTRYALFTRFIYAIHTNSKYTLLLPHVNGDEELFHGVTVKDFCGPFPFGAIDKKFQVEIKKKLSGVKFELKLGFHYDPRINTRDMNRHQLGAAIDIVPTNMSIEEVEKKLRKGLSRKTLYPHSYSNYLHISRDNKGFREHKFDSCLAYALSKTKQESLTHLGVLQPDVRVSSSQYLSELYYHWPDPNSTKSKKQS